MSAPDDDTSSHAGGIMNGHGVGIALVAIFVGVALVVAFAASDGAIFGMNFSSISDNNSPVNDGDAGGAGVLSRDMFDEGSAEESARSDSSGSAAGTAERGPVRQTPALQGAEPLDMSDRILVGVTRERDELSSAEIIDIETPIDTPPANDDEEPQEGGAQQEDSSGSGNDGGQPNETGNEGNSGSGSNSTGSNSTGSNSTGSNSTGSNSTGSNSTSDEGPSGSGGSGDGSSGEGSGIEALISIG